MLVYLFHWKPTSSLSIPCVVGFSVRTQRCLLTIPSKPFLPHSGENLLDSDLHIWPPMAVFVQPFSFFSKNYHFSSPVNSLRNWALSSHSKVLAYYIPSKQFHTVDKKDFEFWLAHMASNRSFFITIWIGSCWCIFLYSKPTSSLSIPCIVWFSVTSLRCMLTIQSKQFLPHSGTCTFGLR